MACIFPKGVELDLIKAILDQIRSSLPTQKTSYTLGEVDGHNTIAVLPEIGTDSAATAARQMKELLSVISPGDVAEVSPAAGKAQILSERSGSAFILLLATLRTIQPPYSPIVHLHLLCPSVATPILSTAGRCLSRLNNDVQRWRREWRSWALAARGQLPLSEMVR
jgi:hypothetical protein